MKMMVTRQAQRHRETHRGRETEMNKPEKIKHEEKSQEHQEEEETTTSDNLSGSAHRQDGKLKGPKPTADERAWPASGPPSSISHIS